jgi:NADH dehydrogenase [ubiquinone] 1 alpha subcomplex assembly factor 6
VVTNVVNERGKELGAARLVWWRENLVDLCAGNAPAAHPVMQCLAPAVQAGGLSRSFLVRLVEARHREVERLGSVQFRSVAELEAFGEEVYASLSYLNLHAADIKSIEADHAASHLGKASFVAKVIRGVPFHASRRQCFLPMDVCAEKRLSQEELFSGHSSAALSDVILRLATQGKHHVEHAATIEKVPREAGPFLLEFVALQRFFERLERVYRFDVMDPAFAGDRDTWLPVQLFLKRKRPLQ